MKETMQSLPVLIVDDEEQILMSAQTVLHTAGIRNVVTVRDSLAVLPLLSAREIGVIVLDISMPKLSGCDLLVDLTREYPQIPVIFMTAANDLETAVSCMRGGAFDYLLKPVEKGRYITTVLRALEMRSLQSELLLLKNRLLTDELENAGAFSSILTQSKKMRAIFQYVEVIAGTKQPVLISGETGVGKELIARSLHNAAGYSGSFVPVNVAGLDDTMFSDALFGHRKGAFTGAEQRREGLIAQAAGGTLFLDEIGDMTEASQVKLLRLMQERTYFPLGSDVPRQTDARILVATNRDLQKGIKAGTFRNDLYFRLRGHQIHVPPLRERSEDIPMLLHHFIERAALALGKDKPGFPVELVSMLSHYQFPGNVRELELMVFDAVARCRGLRIALEGFRQHIGAAMGSQPQTVGACSSRLSVSTDAALPTLKEAEEALIAQALTLAGGKQGLAASMLGISRQALNKRLSRFKKP
ncbi:MAG TPA: sigma-54 dependent transcriptional regulator [Dissulfurispiraceae bacterium]|nr:sigma-54 dependent transcriptional regulator [Dissulfurispiraceae bacterium]